MEAPIPKMSGLTKKQVSLVNMKYEYFALRGPRLAVVVDDNNH